MSLTEQEILKRNKLIAEFMGGKMIVENYHGINIIKFPDETTKDLWGLKYHSSWDWLMPVVAKIESLGYLVDICGKRCAITHEIDWSEDNKLVATWLAVVEFIKYYNSCQK